jgi:NAD(P)-dependent dehydrogenase (short-subunit alcohol dehydrogenase family)
MEERVALLRAAGAVARPTLEQVRKESRAARRERRAARRCADREAVEAAGIRAAREGPVFVPPPRLELPGGAAEGPELREPRDCYVCKRPYRRLHAFYDALCPECGALNYEKRFQSADLSGRVALVTGARVKIGYHIALKLLRAGARVIATTRFPRDAVRRYAEEPDRAAWWERLEVVGLDLRHAPSVELFADHLVRTRERLDVLVNNACQTVRRPPGFYAHLLEAEQRPLAGLPAGWRGPLEAWEALRGALVADALPAPGAPPASGLPLAALEGAPRAPGLVDSARLSQLRTAWDGADGFAVFPPGLTDQDQQQVDLRRHNTWRMTLAEVPPWEMLEVQLVNAVAPFILVARLKPLLLRPRTGEVHVVNVSAMEGSFSRGTKTDRHPHTNMAKAALNMLTLTSAPDYARDGIWMNAVDTGWVTDEDPAQHADRKREELGFQPPLDVVDGAARVLDPLFAGLRTGVHAWGKFWKDYAPTSW